MSFPRYPEYKASGVAWLGEVPTHWEVARLRFAAALNPSKSEVQNLDPSTLVSFLPMEAIGDDGTLKLDRERPLHELTQGYTYFREGDVTLAKITPCYENGKGAVMTGLRNGVGFGTTELIVTRPKPEWTESAYLHYLFISSRFRALGESHMYGAGGQKRVPDSFVRDFITAWPLVEEQRLIAAFLDRETAKIDALVAEQRRLMDLLKEKRQAVISHAVTKGLNPDATMKDSGVEWLGDVPAHWEIVKLKRLMSSIEQGWSPQCESFPAESSGEWGVLKVGCVNGGSFRPEENKLLPNELEPLPALALHAGDLLVSRANTRELVGSAAVTLIAYPNLLLCDKLYRLRFHPDRANSQFVAFFLGSSEARSQLELNATGASASMVNIAQSAITEILMPTPSVDEQRAIVTSVNRELTRLQTMSTEATRAVHILLERRTSLISAAVTGQIDVRGLASEAAA